MTPKLRALLSIRNYFRRKFTRSRHPWDAHIFKEFKKKVVVEIKSLKEERYNKIILDCNINNNNIFKVIKTKRHINIPPMASASGTRMLTSKKDKAEVLAKTFSENHKNPLCNHLPSHTAMVDRKVKKFLKRNEEFDSPSFSNDDVITVIKDAKTGKASGLDNINIKLIKNFPASAIRLLTILFNLCNKQSYFPSQWKLAKTIAIPKPGKDRKLANSYRQYDCIIKLFL